MTTYRIPDGHEYEEYTKFARYHAPCGIDWIPLQISDKQVKSFDLSQLVEVVDVRLTGMTYDQPAEPPLYYTVPENIYPQALWLGIANGISETQKRKLDIRMAIADSEIARAA